MSPYDIQTIADVTRRLIGPIDPVGETNTDDKRFENLKAMIAVANTLIGDIEYVAILENHSEHSVSRAGKHAKEFLDMLADAP